MTRLMNCCVIALSCVSSAFAQNDFKDLFNGKDLKGWHGDSSIWSVQDESIVGKTRADAPLKANSFLIWEDGKVSDFVLELEYRALAGDESKPFANSGIQYRSRVMDEEKFIVGGYQADIDFDLTYSGINYEERGRGILAQRGQRVTIDAKGEKTLESIGDGVELGKKIKKSEWNHYRIVAQGNRLSHYINDTLMSEVIDMQDGKAAKEGSLALQIHTGPPMVVSFRNIRLKTSTPQ